MSEEWKTLAEQIAGLKRQLADITRERDQYKAMCDLHDAQRRLEILTPVPDDIINITVKKTK